MEGTCAAANFSGRTCHFGSRLNDSSLFYQHLDQFFDIEGIALSISDDQITQGVWDLVQPLQHFRHQLAAVASRQRRQIDTQVKGLPLHPIWAAFKQAVPGGAEKHHPLFGQRRSQTGEGVQGAFVRPMQIFKQQQNGIMPGRGEK